MNNSRIEITVKVQVWTGDDVPANNDQAPGRRCDMTAATVVTRTYGGTTPAALADHARGILSDINRVIPEKLKEEAYDLSRSLRRES